MRVGVAQVVIVLALLVAGGLEIVVVRVVGQWGKIIRLAVAEIVRR